jgi:hypothetical protein
MSSKRITAAVTALALAAAPVSASGVNVASANDDVFANAPSNTTITMTPEEMAATQGEFACGGWCIAGLAAGGAALFGAGVYIGWG